MRSRDCKLDHPLLAVNNCIESSSFVAVAVNHYVRIAHEKRFRIFDEDPMWLDASSRDAALQAERAGFTAFGDGSERRANAVILYRTLGRMNLIETSEAFARTMQKSQENKSR